MSVNLPWITVTRMPCAPMWMEALSVSVTLGLRVMELPASVSLKNIISYTTYAFEVSSTKMCCMSIMYQQKYMDRGIEDYFCCFSTVYMIADNTP